MAFKETVSEECRVATNYVASFELHISDAYLCMAYSYPLDSVEPIFSGFFEDQAELKREHGKQFLKYLVGRGTTICLPVIKRPEIENWQTGMKALEYALELENRLSQLLIDLKTTASADNDNDFLNFMGKYLDKQKRNTTYLQRQLAYYRNEEKQAQEEARLEKPDDKKPGE
ncbi:PREDICTED: ferritin heavy chain B-like [Myotis davidii]|uniref:ferritin heavy chain B-like n=1 Tax=Myotis davidii TaxID=225400 RepID=UPI000766FF02|nr:PREDICTED: ferritin heavy chain B-like [Myotis davidii]